MNIGQLASAEDPTVELMVTPQQRDAERRRKCIEQLRAQVRADRPPRRYTQTTLTVAAATVADWVLLGAHVGRIHPRPSTPLLAAHLGFTVALTLSTVVLAGIWAILWDQCRREARRDEIETLRHEDRVELIHEVLLAGLREQWRGYVTGYRDASERHTLTGPTPLRPRRPRGGDNPGRHHRA